MSSWPAETTATTTVSLLFGNIILTIVPSDHVNHFGYDAIEELHTSKHTSCWASVQYPIQPKQLHVRPPKSSMKGLTLLIHSPSKIRTTAPYLRENHIIVPLLVSGLTTAIFTSS
jgi:hypothetical protein